MNVKSTLFYFIESQGKSDAYKQQWHNKDYGDKHSVVAITKLQREDETNAIISKLGLRQSLATRELNHKSGTQTGIPETRDFKIVLLFRAHRPANCWDGSFKVSLERVKKNYNSFVWFGSSSNVRIDAIVGFVPRYQQTQLLLLVVLAVRIFASVVRVISASRFTTIIRSILILPTTLSNYIQSKMKKKIPNIQKDLAIKRPMYRPICLLKTINT